MGLITLVLQILPDDALSGASQVALMISTAVCVALGMGAFHIKWKVFEDAIAQTIGQSAVSILILLLIGMMSAVWMLSGVVPTLIYYGVLLISPLWLLPCACLASGIVSVFTGTSWTTIATLGVALMGIAEVLGIPAPIAAGAIISGAYFGDKMSPMSDTTVLASSVAGADLFTHIRHMMRTTVPSLLVSLVAFTIVGLRYSGEATVDDSLLRALERTFNLSPLSLLVPAFTLWLILRRTPSLITLSLSALAAVVYALVMQPDVIAQVAATGTRDALSLTKGVWQALYGATQLHTGHEALDALVATRGMRGMLDTVWLILCAMCFGACMMQSGMLHNITHMLLRLARGTVGLVGSTVLTGTLLNLVMGDQFLSIIMNASIYREEYASRGLRPELLSRATEDSATVTSPLVPWTACGMTQSTVLGVATVAYLPWCFFNLISPLMSVIVSAIEAKKAHANQ